jgi:hypothetical protein
VDAFFGFGRLARFHVMTQRQIDVLTDRRRPEFLDETFGIGDRPGSALQNGVR